ncbi:MAG: bifunctional NAD(P)H-hydrate repair enzyme Nnr [Leptospiraceae bacterium]|nr:MAG: bifunctional NAD(P)H-hydrate repair enzyme Nnr [Leptospiraceae bacterium]
MNLITFEQSKHIDSKTIQKGVEEKILMGLAAQSAFITMLHHNFISKDNIYLFLCGSGNNGGDGLALAYLILGSRIVSKNQIYIFLKDKPKSVSSQFYYEMLLKNHLMIYPLEDIYNLNLINDKKIILIEGLLGSGQKNLPRSPYKEILEFIKKLKEKLKEKLIHIALDIPAGLSEEYDAFNEKEFLNFFGLSVPDYIFNFGLKKLVLLHPLIHAQSKIFVLPCGFDPEEQSQIVKQQLEFIEWDLLNDFFYFKKRPYEHKYQSGYGWLFAGSNNMEGAAILSAKSFFYSGGGILHLIHFSNHRDLFLKIEPSIIYHHFEEWKENYINLKLPQCIVIGPGLSKNDIEIYQSDFIKFFQFLVSINHYPIIILDAYATTLILDKNFPEQLKPFTIITPHLGEWKLLKGEFPYLVSNWQYIEELYKTLGVSILIKGSISFFIPSYYFKERKVFVWKYQNPHLSVAGSGDVLTGIMMSYFSKNNHNSYKNIANGMNLILSLQNKIAEKHSTAHDQINNLKNLINNL